MLFTSLDYYFFLTLVFFAFWIGRSRRLTPLILICAANLFFYGRWGVTYLVLIPAASYADYFLGGLIYRTSGSFARRVAVSASIVMNSGLIVLCRYVSLPLWSGTGL